ncbi:hypothetical protein Syun_030942 [Stephania yunnanensis]|uniref:Uncharacterized protein n=1 Tax=Stephania yunnanensis TaxID=152371 RepID=A0AAP0HGK3_9MAGN
MDACFGQIWSFSMKSACCKHEIIIQTDPKNCEYVIISGAQRKTEDFDIEDAETFALPADEQEDLAKKKEAEPVLVRLQRVSDARHSDDYALNKAKKRVADEEAVARKIGLGIRLLPGSEEDSSMAKHVKFSSKFDKNKKNKRVAIVSSSIFSGLSDSQMSTKKRLELESKRRRINAREASSLLTGKINPSSWSLAARTR